MYINLKRLLNERNISIKNYGAILGISEKTAQNKLNGVTAFTLPEVNKTLELFPEYTLKHLFNADIKAN